MCEPSTRFPIWWKPHASPPHPCNSFRPACIRAILFGGEGGEGYAYNMISLFSSGQGKPIISWRLERKKKHRESKKKELDKGIMCFLIGLTWRLPGKSPLNMCLIFLTPISFYIITVAVTVFRPDHRPDIYFHLVDFFSANSLGPQHLLRRGADLRGFSRMYNYIRAYITGERVFSISWPPNAAGQVKWFAGFDFELGHSHELLLQISKIWPQKTDSPQQWG